MPRKKKIKQSDGSFFLNDRGVIEYYSLCKRCEYDCKQSFRVISVQCPKYRPKRSKWEK